MSTGSVYRRADGLWCASVRAQGKRKTVYAKTEREARAKLAKLQKQLGITDILPTPGRKTVDDLLDLWLETADLRPITLAGYRETLDRYVRPTIGHVRLSRLHPETIQTLYNDLRARDLRRIPKLVHSLLHRAFKMAVLWGWLAENPTDRVIAPTHKPERKPVWAQHELQTFLAGARDHRLYPLWVVTLNTGIRLAELSGLKWSDVDFAGGTISVQRTLHWVKGRWVEGEPKTKAGARAIALPTDGIAALRRQKAQQNEWRLKAGKEWQNGGWVFTTGTGAPVPRSSVQYCLREMCTRLGIPPVSPHGLRHLHASLLLAGGLPVPAVSARLGHANPNVTMSVYAHAFHRQDQEAARIMEEAVR